MGGNERVFVSDSKPHNAVQQNAVSCDSNEHKNNAKMALSVWLMNGVCCVLAAKITILKISNARLLYGGGWDFLLLPSMLD